MAEHLTRRGFLETVIGAGAAVALVPGGAAAETPVAPSAGEGAAAPAETVTVETTVNGEARTLHVGAETRAVDVLRDTLGLTGTKEACGHGACGACAVQVDGRTAASCLLPATALHGAAVRTVEGLGLHPVQRAFLAKDALQCGYCTPGFVVEAVAFYDAWRRGPGAPDPSPGGAPRYPAPSREQVADALAGHLCRCGAYEHIWEAVRAACAGEFDGDEVVVPERRDALDKVTGRARYTVDVKLPGMLHARILRSPHAAAVVRSVSVEAARAAPGVRAVLPLVEPGQWIRHAGQALVALAADTEAAARAALALLSVEAEPQPFVLGFDDALAEGAPPVWDNTRLRGKPNANESPLLPEPWQGNLRGPAPISLVFGQSAAKARKAVAEAPELVSGRWSTQAQAHCTLEPHAAVAWWEGEKLTVWLGTQAVGHVAQDLAEHFDLRRDAVEVIAEHIGGGFGGKATLQLEALLAARLAREAGAPVRLVLDRAEELDAAWRPACRAEVAVASRDGALEGITYIARNDSGVGIGATTSGPLSAIYAVSDAKWLQDWDVLTHQPTASPMRGPGGPQSAWALEQAVDELALRRGEDPLALRRRWEVDPLRHALLDRAAAVPWWRERVRGEGRVLTGVGAATAAWFHVVAPHTEIQVSADPDGPVRVACGTQDMGQGSRSVLARVVADALGIGLDEVDVRVGHSTDVQGPTSAGSCTTNSVAAPARLAAEQLRDAWLELAADALGLVDPRPAPGGVAHAGGFTPWSEVRAAGPRYSFVARRPRDRGGYSIVGSGGSKLGKGSGYAVMLAQVTVDTRTGRVRVARVWSGLAIGRVVVPRLAENQARGAVVQGVSYALYEQLRRDPNTGRLLTAGMEDYKVAGLGDVPEVEVHFEPGGYAHVPDGVGGMSEIATIPTAAAVGNAVANATGRRFYDLPLRPDVVLAGLS